MSNQLVVDFSVDSKGAVADILKLVTPIKEIDAAVKLASVSFGLMSDAVDKIAAHTGIYEWGETAKSMVTDMVSAIKSVPKEIVTTAKTVKDFGEVFGGLGKKFTALKTLGSSTFGALRQTIKGMPTGMKFSLAVVGAQMVGQAIAWVADQISAAHDRAIAKTIKTAEIEKKAWDQIRYVREAMRQQGGEEYREWVEQFQNRKAQLREQGKTSGEIALIIAKEYEKQRKEIEKVAKAEAERVAAIKAHEKAVADLSTRYGIYTGEHLDKLVTKQQTMLGIWEQSKDKISGSSDSTKRYLQDLKQLRDHLGDRVDPQLNTLIATLERTNDQFERKKAILDYSRSLGFLVKSDVTKEMDLMTAALQKYGEQCRRNPGLIEPMLQKIEELKTKAKQANVEIPQEWDKQEQELKDLKAAYDDAANSVYIFGVKMPIDQLKKMQEETEKNEQAVTDYASSLGFFKKEDLAKEIDLMTQTLKKFKEQFKDNPEMVAKLTKKIEELRKKAKQGGVDLTDAFEQQAKAVEDENKKIEENKKKVIELTDKQEKLANALGMSAEQFKKFSDITGSIGSALSKVSGHGKEVLGFLGDTGIVSGKTKEALGGLLDGVSQVGAGFSELAINPIGGALKILGGVVKSVTNLFKLFAGDGVGEAIDRERQMIDISEEMEGKIRELEKTIGDTHAATSMLMDELIKDAEINEENFSNYVQRTRDILADLDSGTLSVKETQEAMGKAFNELLGEAQRLGTEGSKEMIELIGDVRGRGLEVAEIQDYVNEKLDQGVQALQTYLSTFADTGAIQEQIAALTAELAEGTLTAEEVAAKQEELTLKQQELSLATQDVTANWGFMQTAAMSTFHALEAQGNSFVEIVAMMQGQLAAIAEMAQANGLEIHEGLQAMTNLANFIAQNEELANRIESTRIMMEALGDSAFMTANDFESFAAQTALQFEEIMTRTTDQEMALRLISPALEDLIKYSKSYGYTIDENTQALIDQAREEGVLAKEQKSHHEITNELLLSIAEALGAKIPESLRKMVGGFEASMASIQGETGRWSDSLYEVEGQIRKNLTGAIHDFDDEYTDAMTGHSIVTQTGKWKYSLEEVEEILGRDLIDTANELEKKYSHVLGDINDYLEKTSSEGFKARLTFDEMVDELQVLQNAYNELASKTERTDVEENILADYKRQIEELTTAIEESAPTLENYRKRFNELKSDLTGSIGVNTEMIGIARGLRSQGLSTEEIDKQIESSLTGGAKGLADWVITAEDQEEFEQSQAMILSYFSALQSEGKSLTEIMAIMGDSFDAVAGKTMTEEMEENGFQLSETFSQLYELQQKMAENDDLIKGIEGLSGALHGMGDSMLYMTEDTFVNFETASVNAFEKLKAAGFDQKQSLQLLAPLLKDLEAYSAEYGYSLDATTAKLLEEAKESGLIKEEQKTDTEKLIDVNTQLAEVMQSMVDTFTDMGEASPFNMMEEQAIGLQKEIKNMRSEVEKLYDQKEKYTQQATEGYVSAALGFHGVLPKNTWFRLHKGERVDVWSPEETRKIQATSIRRMNLSDTRPSQRKGDIIFEHITIQSENGEEAVRDFMTAIKNNKYGVKNLIRKVAR